MEGEGHPAPRQLWKSPTLLVLQPPFFFSSSPLFCFSSCSRIVSSPLAMSLIKMSLNVSDKSLSLFASSQSPRKSPTRKPRKAPIRLEPKNAIWANRAPVGTLQAIEVYPRGKPLPLLWSCPVVLRIDSVYLTGGMGWEGWMDGWRSTVLLSVLPLCLPL